MPILNVEIVLRPGEELPPGLAGRIAERCAAVLGSGPAHTWVKLRALPSEGYAENGVGRADGPFPVFVELLQARRPAEVELRALVLALTKVVAEVCNRPIENVHLILAPPAAGRVAFGGRIVEE